MDNSIRLGKLGKQCCPVYLSIDPRGKGRCTPRLLAPLWLHTSPYYMVTQHLDQRTARAVLE